jgi:small-conductance mechanosensitive channel
LGIDRWQDFLFQGLAGQLILLVVSVIFIRLLLLASFRVLDRRLHTTERRYKAHKLLDILAFVLTVIAVALIFSPQLGDLTIAIGIFGAGIAFALQEVIVSIAGWFAISFSGFYTVGDRVQLGGIKGDVIDIGLLRTTLMEIGEWVRGDNYNGRIVRVANSVVFKEPVFNYSADFPYLWDEINLPIKYGSDYDLARKIMETVTYGVVSEDINGARQAWAVMETRYLVEKASVEPQVVMYANENYLSFTVRYVVHYKRRRATKDQIFTRILEEMEKVAGKIDIGAPSLEIIDDTRLEDEPPRKPARTPRRFPPTD